MTEQQKRLIKKLNEDNKKLNELHKDWIQYAHAKILIGFILILALIVCTYLAK